MKNLTITEKGTSNMIVIDALKLEGVSTKSLYVRKGFKNGTLFLSQKGNGAWGAGDVCKLSDEAIEVGSNLYERIKIYAEKAQATLVECL